MTSLRWQDAAARLADTVAKDAPGWHDAVASTPRHLLVPHWWRHDPMSLERPWIRADAPVGGSEHLKAAYSDQTLVTRVGALHADDAAPGQATTGDATSSSTLPGLIVSMAAMLAPHPADRILDVGTGTGYATALLAHRFGDTQVISVDVDGYLVRAARDRLGEIGLRPEIAAVDASRAVPEGTYDRILATVSVRPLPKSWVEALAPGGRVVTTIAATSLLIVADKDPDGVVHGRVQDHAATFMRTRGGEDYPPRLHDVYRLARDADGDTTRPLGGPLWLPWRDWELFNLLELDTPGIEARTATHPDGHEITRLLAADGSWARAENSPVSRVHQGGPRRLWDRLEQVNTRWETTGRFPMHALRVELAPDQGLVRAPGNWTLHL